MEHGSKQWASVTENVNDFVDELLGAVVGLGVGGVVVAGELVGGLAVIAGTDGLVAGLTVVGDDVVVVTRSVV
ncbi:MAG: hypothetical protein ABMA25_10955, partial [Ilumatobacteraceae bacterium]